MSTFVFDIEKLNTNINDVVKHVEKFYKFDADIPPICVFESNSKVYVVLTSAAKKNLNIVEEANSKLTKKKLSTAKFTLSKPKKTEVDVCSWWNAENKLKEGEKWFSLEHNGPYFLNVLEPYKAKGLSIKYNGKTIKLRPLEEEVLMLYATILYRDKQGTAAVSFTKDPVFNENFNKDMVKYISKEHKEIKDVTKINFTSLLKNVETSKLSNKTPLEKHQRACKNKQLKTKYGYARVNGFLEEVGNYTVEPFGIFQGRGKQPNRGRIKPKIYPEDVTINIGENAKVPTPPAGHRWGSVIHDKEAEWIARWKDVISNAPKYTRFSAKGQFKGKNDYQKFEIVRQLNKDIDHIRSVYEKDLNSASSEIRQVATILYLIDHFGIRPGGASSQEVGVVGASTLQVKNVKAEGTKLHLDFLGKDSVRYQRDLQVIPKISQNIKSFQKGKTPTQELFSVSADDVNKYIQSINPLYSAKKFRTRLASELMNEELKQIKVPKNATADKKKFLLDQANIRVAVELNHIKTAAKGSKDALKKIKDKIKKYTDELKELQSKPKTEALKNRIQKKKDMIQREKDKYTLRTKTTEVSPGTSRTNYIDPRILLSWADKYDLPIEKVYSKALREKFEWAVCKSSKDWSYENTPINEELLKKAEPKARSFEPGRKDSRRPVLPANVMTRGLRLQVKKPTRAQQSTRGKESVKKHVTVEEGESLPILEEEEEVEIEEPVRTIRPKRRKVSKDTIEKIKNARLYVYEQLILSHVKPYLTTITPSTLQKMFNLYDTAFFGGEIRKKMMADKYSVEFITVAGKSSAHVEVANKFIRIVFPYNLHSKLGAGRFRETCNNNLECIQKVFEHELIHLLMLLYKQQDNEEYGIRGKHGKLFYCMLKRIFGFANRHSTNLAPMTKPLTENDVAVDDRVYFNDTHGVIMEKKKDYAVVMPYNTFMIQNVAYNMMNIEYEEDINRSYKPSENSPEPVINFL